MSTGNATSAPTNTIVPATTTAVGQFACRSDQRPPGHAEQQRQDRRDRQPEQHRPQQRPPRRRLHHLTSSHSSYPSFALLEACHARAEPRREETKTGLSGKRFPNRAPDAAKTPTVARSRCDESDVAGLATIRRYRGSAVRRDEVIHRRALEARRVVAGLFRPISCYFAVGAAGIGGVGARVPVHRRCRGTGHRRPRRHRAHHRAGAPPAGALPAVVPDRHAAPSPSWPATSSGR